MKMIINIFFLIRFLYILYYNLNIKELQFFKTDSLYKIKYIIKF